MRALFDNRKKDTSGQLLTMGRSGSSISNTLCQGPDKNGWAENSDRMPYVEYAESAVPSSRRMNQGLAFTQDGALYITGDAVTSTSNKVNGIAIRADGALHVAPAGSTATLKSNGMGITASGQVIMAESFVLPLNTSVVPLIGTGSATYTRATVATVFDNESVLRNVLSGEARFHGARRVANLLTNSEVLTGWTKSGLGTITGGVSDPLGGTSAYTFTAGSASEEFYQQVVAAVPVGASMVQSAWIRRRTGTGVIGIATHSGGTFTTVAVTTSWQRLSSAIGVTGNTTAIFDTRITTSGDAVDVWHPQSEDVTGQSNQAPAEYVSVGVLSTPFHGAGVDGVKYLSTTNGNSVASNVVTESAGSPISASTLLGYLAEGARTNLCLWSADLTNSTGGWLVGTTTPTANYVTAAGLSFTRLTGITAAAYLYRDITFTGDGTKAVSFFVRSDGVDGFGKFGLYDSSMATYRAKVRYTIASGVVSFSAEAGSAMTVDALAGGVYRCTIAAPGVVAANVNYLLPLTNGEGTTLTSVQLSGIQAEDASFASSYIPTTTASVVRNADVLTYPTAGNISGTVGSAYMEASCLEASGPNYFLTVNVATDSPLLYNNGSIATYDGTSDLTGGVFARDGVIKKFAASYGGATRSVAITGASASGAFDGDLGVGANFALGCRFSNANTLSGTIRNVRIYSAQLSAAQLSAVTV